MLQKVFLSLMALLFIEPLNAEPRDITERIKGVGYIERETKVKLGKPILDINQKPRQEVILTTPHTKKWDARLNLDKKRSLVFITQDNLKSIDPPLAQSIKKATKGDHNNYYVLGNFVHLVDEKSDPSFFVAIIPRNIKVEEVALQVEWFGDGAGAHTQIRFVLNQPILAISEATNFTPLSLQNENGKADLVYSLQAARVQGGDQDWGVLQGLMGEYANALSLFSSQALAKKQIFDSVVREYRLTNLNSKQKNSIFRTALVKGHRLQESSIYNTVFNSCITHSLIALKGSGKLGGIETIDTTWFNPYSILEKISRAGITTEFTGTVNDRYAYLQDYAEDGQAVMTEQQRRANEIYQTIAPLERTLLTSESFESLVQKAALYIIDKKIRAQQVENFLTTAREAIAQNEKLESTFSGEAKKFYKQLIKIWKSDSELSQRPIKDFIYGLSSLKTQDSQ